MTRRTCVKRSDLVRLDHRHEQPGHLTQCQGYIVVAGSLDTAGRFDMSHGGRVNHIVNDCGQSSERMRASVPPST